MKRIYLDFAAAAPVTDGARAAFLRALPAYGNPSAAHAEGREGKAILEEARRKIATLAGAKPEAVIFTAGATEANAIALKGHIRARLKAGREAGNPHILYLPGAHASVTETIESLTREGIAADPLPLKDGDIDLAALGGLIRPETALISMEAVSAETGARFDTRGVRHVLDAARKGAGRRILLHVDATQLPLVESFERTRLAADLISLDAQKVGGVRGIGCLIVAPGVELLPVIEGGGQERGLRSGTESPAAAAAFATVLEEAAEKRELFSKHADRARAEFISLITDAIPDAVVNCGRKNAPHILNFSFPARDTDYLAALMDERGFAVSTKSACESNDAGSMIRYGLDEQERVFKQQKVTGSRAVLAQSGDLVRASSTLRISWGRETKDGDLTQAAKALIAAVRFLDSNTI